MADWSDTWARTRAWGLRWRRTGLILSGLVVVLAQPWLAPHWAAQLGDALREVAVLVLVFGLLEKVWDGKRMDSGYIFGAIVFALALFSAGNIFDSRVAIAAKEGHHAVPDGYSEAGAKEHAPEGGPRLGLDFDGFLAGLADAGFVRRSGDPPDAGR